MNRWMYSFAGVLLLVSMLMTPLAAFGQAVYAGPPVTLPKSHGDCGIYSYRAFNGTAGQLLTSSVSANDSLNIYLMNAAEFEAWQHQTVSGGICTPAATIASQINVASTVLNATIPATGTYYLVLNNLSPSSAATATVTANLT